VATDLDGTLTRVLGNGFPLKILWKKLLCEYPGIELKEMPERIDEESFVAIISALEKSGATKDSVQRIACKFPLRQGMREFFRAISEVNGLLVILTVNPFGEDWVKCFFPEAMPNCRIVATTPVWQDGVLTRFQNIVTPQTKKVLPDLPGVKEREVILIGDAPKDIRMIDGLNNQGSPLITAIGLCWQEERQAFTEAGFDTLLPIDSPMISITNFIRSRYLPR